MTAETPMKSVDTDIWQCDACLKFYFRDETEDLNGPYDTLADSKDALTRYVKWLNGPEEYNANL